MTARWVPDDHDLDEVARTLPPHAPSRETAEQLRTSVLVNAAAQKQQSRRSSAPFAVVGIAIAAAAGLALWLEKSDRTAKQVIASIGVAQYERASDWPDFAVHLTEGRIDVRVTALDAADRFRIATLDAAVATRGAHFEVAAEHDRIQSVLVDEGRVEIRAFDQHVVILSAGESWTAPKVVQRDDQLAPPAPATMPSRPEPAPPVVAALPADRAKRPHVATPPERSAPPSDTIVPARPAEKPGEAEFRAGWAALRAGDASAAAKAFSTACTEALHAPLGEDACFWTGAAAKRAGDATLARNTLDQFLKQFPGSPRAPEAAALLGWLLYEAGELDAAEKAFRSADHDRVPKVRDSAQRGLEAIQRRRVP